MLSNKLKLEIHRTLGGCSVFYANIFRFYFREKSFEEHFFSRNLWIPIKQSRTNLIFCHNPKIYCFGMQQHRDAAAVNFFGKIVFEISIEF